MPLPEDVVPFDAASEMPVEEQRTEALLRIQGCLRDAQVPQALRLLRSARYQRCNSHPAPWQGCRDTVPACPPLPRDVWPEGDVFGPPDAGPPEETQLLREILFAPLPCESLAGGTGNVGHWVECLGPQHCPTTGHAPPEAEEPEEEEDEEEEEEEETMQVSEKEFNFLDYLKR